MRSTVRLLWRIGLFAAVMVVLLVVIVQVIRRPVPGAAERYTAVFTDANGLRVGADVRMYGLPVGKVESLSLEGADAKVRFTVQRGHPLYEGATLAIRFQTLAGQRYIDVRQPDRAGPRLAPGTTFGADRTTPAFDITALFNGLQPVLAEATPEAVNHFAESMLAVINGDGSGIGAALDAVERLAGFVSDRQTVISTLVRNLREMSDALAGRAPHMITVIGGLAEVFGTLEQRLQGVVDYAQTIPPLLLPLDSLAARLGLTPGVDTEIDRLLRAALPDPEVARETLRRLPALLRGLDALASGTTESLSASCGNGPVPAPAPLAMLFAGQEITLCRG
ncbi:MlaD family protein [Nocardia otitidiscaviarum]|uniref:MlaD family protein n=1 Tax=Nocardia otitidiscaviarum TaxID=1823 RepID=UPI002456DD1B|nr:MCE family protein [Nocardia otitidiscaviarum]